MFFSEHEIHNNIEHCEHNNLTLYLLITIILMMYLRNWVNEWPSDQMPNDWVTVWQEASQTIDRMVFYSIELPLR